MVLGNGNLAWIEGVRCRGSDVVELGEGHVRGNPGAPGSGDRRLDLIQSSWARDTNFLPFLFPLPPPSKRAKNTNAGTYCFIFTPRN